MKYKIRDNAAQVVFAGLLQLFFSPSLTAQTTPAGPAVISRPRNFLKTVRADSGNSCYPLSGIPNLRLDLRYGGYNNFTKAPVYDDDPEETYLRRDAALALDSVAQDMALQGLGLLVFDAYRPYRATVALWALVHDDRYAADPAKGSGHNRAIAVDLSLYELATNRLLTMPTGFDNFSDSAHQDFMRLPDSVVAHRQVLRSIMEKHGFIPLATEWWHFSWPHPERFELLDLTFDQMGRLEGKSRSPARFRARAGSVVPAAENPRAPSR